MFFDSPPINLKSILQVVVIMDNNDNNKQTPKGIIARSIKKLKNILNDSTINSEISDNDFAGPQQALDNLKKTIDEENFDLEKLLGGAEKITRTAFEDISFELEDGRPIQPVGTTGKVEIDAFKNRVRYVITDFSILNNGQLDVQLQINVDIDNAINFVESKIENAPVESLTTDQTFTDQNNNTIEVVGRGIDTVLIRFWTAPNKKMMDQMIKKGNENN